MNKRKGSVAAVVLLSLAVQGLCYQNNISSKEFRKLHDFFQKKKMYLQNFERKYDSVAFIQKFLMTSWRNG